ncbi:MAG: hypothetical protein ABGY75_08635, partial [Gemmataceae bacterium]
TPTAMGPTIFRRWLFSLGALFFLRGIAISITMLPNPYEGCVSTADEKNPWQYRFSLNTPAEESSLDKVPEEAIAEVFGPNAIAHVDRDVKFRDLLETKFDRPVELFPMLMLLVLLFLALEGLVANRFYKLK